MKTCSFLSGVIGNTDARSSFSVYSHSTPPIGVFIPVIRMPIIILTSPYGIFHALTAISHIMKVYRSLITHERYISLVQYISLMQVSFCRSSLCFLLLLCDLLKHQVFRHLQNLNYTLIIFLKYNKIHYSRTR